MWAQERSRRGPQELDVAFNGRTCRSYGRSGGCDNVNLALPLIMSHRTSYWGEALLKALLIKTTRSHFF
jgi:hypothetical protein